MQKVMMVIALLLGFALTACQTTTTQNATSSGWEDSETGREFRLRSGISCRAWNHGSPTFADEISKHFSSQYQGKIDEMRRYEASWVQLCNDLPLVKTKKQARSWLKNHDGLIHETIINHNYWIGSPLRWSDVEEAKIWHAYLCRSIDSMESKAQIIANVIAENNPWNATRATQKAEDIAAKASNVCSRGYDGVEKKFISESKGVWESHISLWRLSKK